MERRDFSMLAPPHCYSVIFWFYFHLSSLSSISFWLLFRCPVVSDYLWPHGLQDARPPRPSPSSGVCASSCPLHCWCRPAILSSVALFPCPKSFPASGTFPMSRLVTKILEIQLQHQSFQWVFRVDFLWLLWSPCSPRDSQECSPETQFKSINSSFSAQLCLWSSSHIHTWLLEKP